MNARGSGTTQTAVLGGGCFWCLEAIYQRVRGVSEVISGYATGGAIKTPVEVVKFEFDPEVINYTDLLEIFWAIHDPKSFDQQGADVGPQYKSAIFTTSQEQAEQARASKQNVSGAVTQIVPLENFQTSEDYHHNYYNKNSDASYCRVVIEPKLQKFLKQFEKRLK